MLQYWNKSCCSHCNFLQQGRSCYHVLRLLHQSSYTYSREHFYIVTFYKYSSVYPFPQTKNSHYMTFQPISKKKKKEKPQKNKIKKCAENSIQNVKKLYQKYEKYYFFFLFYHLFPWNFDFFFGIFQRYMQFITLTPAHGLYLRLI